MTLVCCARLRRWFVAAQQARVPVEICGEAASDPIAAPLLIGSDIDEVSVGAARVGTVRGWVRTLSFTATRDLQRKAQSLKSADDVEKLVAATSERLLLDERADTDAEILERPVGVGAAGAEAERRPAPGS